MRGSSNDEPSLYGPTTGGGPISDGLIEKLADEAEAGYDVDALVARRANREFIAQNRNQQEVRIAEILLPLNAGELGSPKAVLRVWLL